MCVRPNHSFHMVSLAPDGTVIDINHVGKAGLWINGGFFAFRREVFDYMREGEELVQEPFHRLISDDQLVAYRHEGFWACMDTLKDKQLFDELHARGERPWEVWKGKETIGPRESSPYRSAADEPRSRLVNQIAGGTD